MPYFKHDFYILLLYGKIFINNNMWYLLSNSLMQSYTPRALDRRLQEDWTRDAREGPRVLMSLMIDFGPMG